MRFSDEKGFWELNPFPGCNQLIVSNHAFVYPEYRNKGVGKALHEKRLAQAKRLGYDYIICTVVATNYPQIKILERFKWEILTSFKNMETGNVIYICGRSLYDIHLNESKLKAIPRDSSQEKPVETTKGQPDKFYKVIKRHLSENTVNFEHDINDEDAEEEYIEIYMDSYYSIRLYPDGTFKFCGEILG